MRIAIAGISHEALNFSPITASLKDFQIWRGEEILTDQLAPYPSGRSAGHTGGLFATPGLL